MGQCLSYGVSWYPVVKACSHAGVQDWTIASKIILCDRVCRGSRCASRLGSLETPDDEMEALVLLLRNLSESKISHGDMKATNFLMADDGPVIIDLDAMREHKNSESFQRAYNKDMDRFMKNWEDHPELASQFEGLLIKFPSR